MGPQGDPGSPGPTGAEGAKGHMVLLRFRVKKAYGILMWCGGYDNAFFMPNAREVFA